MASIVLLLGDHAGLDPPAPVEAHVVEQPAVVGDQQQCTVVRRQRLLELLDRRQVEVVGGLVEDQQVDPATLEQGERGAGALPRREPADLAGDLVGLEAELRQQGADVGGRQLGQRGLDGVAERQLLGEAGAGLVDLADGDRRAEAGGAGVGPDPPEQQADQRGLAGAVGAGDADPVARVDLQRGRPEAEVAALQRSPR